MLQSFHHRKIWVVEIFGSSTLPFKLLATTVSLCIFETLRYSTGATKAVFLWLHRHIRSIAKHFREKLVVVVLLYLQLCLSFIVFTPSIQFVILCKSWFLPHVVEGLNSRKVLFIKNDRSYWSVWYGISLWLGGQ